MTVARTGADHIASLRDGRTVYIDGQLVPDVTTHPAFRNAVRSAGALYDFQAKPENIELMTFAPEGSSRRVNRAWQMPRSYEEMVLRRKALQAWARVHYGFMGRWAASEWELTFSGSTALTGPRRSSIISTTPRGMTCSLHT